MTHEDLLNRISSRELVEWQAFGLLEPFGEHRADLRSGIIASTIANANRDAEKHPEPYKPQEFMPGYETRDYTLQEVRAWFGEKEEGEQKLEAEALAAKILTVFGHFKRKEVPRGDN